MTSKAPARVLMLLENNPYPQDLRVQHEAAALAQAGYAVSVVCPARDGQPRFERLDGVSVYRFPSPPEGSGVAGYAWEYAYATAAAFAASLRVLRREGIDIVHAHNPPDTFVLVAAFYKLLGKRFIFDHHDLAPEMYEARFGPGRPLVRRTLLLLERLSLQLADVVLSTNASYRTLAIERGGARPEDVTVVRNGPDGPAMASWEPTDVLGGEARTVIGYAGVIGVQDGVDHLIRAIDYLVHALGRDDVLCLVIGDGDALPSLRQLVRELGLDRHVRFTGWLRGADFHRHLAATDICVVPEPSNAYNDRSTVIKLMDYMAAGKPVVAFDLPEHRVSADGAALFARPNDDRDLAAAIAALVDDPARRGRLGEAGRMRVERELAWRFSVPHLLAAYDHARRRRPGRIRRLASRLQGAHRA